MDQLPAQVMSTNLGKWAVPACDLPAVAVRMASCPGLAFEPWDRGFQGQDLETTYFDAPSFALRKARMGADQYLTLRLRCYKPPGGEELYAVGVKTQDQKLRLEIDPLAAEATLSGQLPFLTLIQNLLPASVLAQLQSLAGDEPLVPVARVYAHRYTVGDADDRLTLDTNVHTARGQRLPYGVLEFKSMDPGATPPGNLSSLLLQPAKISKFLWATGY